jgi:hypothetical protein
MIRPSRQGGILSLPRKGGFGMSDISVIPVAYLPGVSLQGHMADRFFC